MCVLVYVHVCVSEHSHVHLHRHTQHTYTLSHTYIHSLTHAQTHTHTHTRTLSLSLSHTHTHTRCRAISVPLSKIETILNDNWCLIIGQIRMIASIQKHCIEAIERVDNMCVHTYILKYIYIYLCTYIHIHIHGVCERSLRLAAPRGNGLTASLSFLSPLTNFECKFQL